ncbi:MAG TPA: TonB-dependent receptor, partial [Flavitalea sp.]|nr:TonB-dependent receptor [Flavitalea sp.]
PVAGGGEALPSSEDYASTQAQVPWQDVQHFKIIADNRFQLKNGNITANLGWQRNNRQEFGNPDNSSEQSLGFSLETFNYKAIYHRDNHTGWNSSFGVSGMHQDNSISGQELLIPEYRLFDAGVFAYAQKTVDKFTVSGGARYDTRKLTTTQLMEGIAVKFPGLDTRFSNVSASAGMTFEGSDELLFKFNLAKGFRAPSIPELASNGAHEGTNRYEYGNPDMKSESSWQADAGMEYNSDHLFMSATAFYNHINNFIFYSKLNSINGGDSLVSSDGDLIPAYQYNQRTANLYGLEMQIDIHPHPLDWLHWENSLSYVRGKFAEALDGSENLPLIPSAHWLTELRGEFMKKGKMIRNLSVYSDLDITFSQTNAFTGYQTETITPGYLLLNAGFTGSLMRKNKQVMTFYISANNLGDVAYQSHLSRLKYTEENMLTARRGVFNMGRNFMFKINIPLMLYH